MILLKEKIASNYISQTVGLTDVKRKSLYAAVIYGWETALKTLEIEAYVHKNMATAAAEKSKSLDAKQTGLECDADEWELQAIEHGKAANLLADAAKRINELTYDERIKNGQDTNTPEN